MCTMRGVSEDLYGAIYSEVIHWVCIHLRADDEASVLRCNIPVLSHIINLLRVPNPSTQACR